MSELDSFGFLGVATWIDYSTDFATLGRAFNCHSCICNSIGFVRCVEGMVGFGNLTDKAPIPYQVLSRKVLHLRDLSFAWSDQVIFVTQQALSGSSLLVPRHISTSSPSQRVSWDQLQPPRHISTHNSELFFGSYQVGVSFHFYQVGVFSFGSSSLR